MIDMTKKKRKLMDDIEILDSYEESEIFYMLTSRLVENQRLMVNNIEGKANNIEGKRKVKKIENNFEK